MKINIISQKYGVVDPPVLTKKMIDWVLLTLWSKRLENWYQEIHSVDIVANTAYNGSNRIHFYITINKDKSRDPFHKVFEINQPLHLQTPSLGYGPNERGYTSPGVKQKRRDWIEYFLNRDVDFGEMGERMKIKYEKQRQYKLKELEVERERRAKESRYKMYLQLKKEFEPIKD